MSLKSVLWISVLFALLVGVVLYSNQRETDKEQAADYTKELLDFDKNLVDELTIEAKGGRVLMQKVGEAWNITEPLELEASRGGVLAMLANLERARLNRFVLLDDDDDGEILKEYGLDPPHVRVTLRVQGSILDTVDFGNSPFGKFVYVKKSSENRIGMTEIYRRTGVDKDLSALRDRRALTFEQSEATGLRVESPEGTVELAKAAGEWLFQQPRDGKADGVAVEAFLVDLSSVAGKFVDEAPAKLGDYGLDPAQMRVDIDVVSAGGTEMVESLLIGTEMDGVFYAKDGSRAAVFTLDSTLVNQLPVAVFGLGQKHLVRFERKSIDRIEFAYPAKSILCVRHESSWATISPPQAVNGDEIDAILFNMEKLQAERFLPSVAEANSRGLDTPRMVIRIWSEDQAVGELTIGGDATTDKLYAKGSDNEFDSVIDKTKAERLTAERIFAQP